MPLTQVAPICSMRADGGVPAESDGIRGELRQPGGMSGVSGAAPVAGGFRLSALRIGSAKAWPVRDLWQCAGCGCHTSVTAGTIFQDTRTPLTVWFRAMWWVTTQKNDPEERRQRVGTATGAGPEEFREALWYVMQPMERLSFNRDFTRYSQRAAKLFSYENQTLGSVFRACSPDVYPDLGGSRHQPDRSRHDPW